MFTPIQEFAVMEPSLLELPQAGASINSNNSRRTFSVTSDASVQELMGAREDRSLVRAGEEIRLTKCEDETVTDNAYKYCKRCLSGTWAKITPDQLTVTYVT